MSFTAKKVQCRFLFIRITLKTIYNSCTWCALLKPPTHTITPSHNPHNKLSPQVRLYFFKQKQTNKQTKNKTKQKQKTKTKTKNKKQKTKNKKTKTKNKNKQTKNHTITAKDFKAQTDSGIPTRRQYPDISCFHR